MINEGQFETSAKTTVSNTKIEKELRSLGLGYNGGDPVYTNDKKNATIASWSLIPNKKAMNLLKANGEFSYPLSYGNNYYLEYNIRTKKFTILRELWLPGKGTKWFNPVEIKNPEVLNSPIFKRVKEIATQMKRNTQVVFTGGNKAYHSAYNYGKEHLKEDYHETANKAVEEFEVMLDKGMKNGKSLYDIKNQRMFENLIKDTLSDFDSLKKEFGPKNAYKVYNFIKSEKAAYDNGKRTCEDTLKNIIDFLENLENKEHSPQETKPNYVSDGIGGVMAKQKEKTKQFANDIASNYGIEHLKEDVNYFPY